MSEENFLEDKYEGLSRAYYKNGKVKTEGLYASSKPLEMKHYFESGLLFASEKFMHNEKSRNRIDIRSINMDPAAFTAEAGGVPAAAGKTGKKAAEWILKDGKLEGSSKIYYESGKPWLELSFAGGRLEGTCKWYFEKENFTKFELNFKAGLMEGVNKWYYEDGRTAQEVNYKAGEKDGICKLYYNSGNLKGEFIFDRGSLNGKAVVYYDIDGSIKYEDTYSSDKLTGRVKREPNFTVVPGEFLEEEY